MIILELELIEYCILKDLSKFDYESEDQAEQTDVDLVFLYQFEQYGGIDIVENIKDKYSGNSELYSRTSTFG